MQPLNIIEDVPQRHFGRSPDLRVRAVLHLIPRQGSLGVVYRSEPPQPSVPDGRPFVERLRGDGV
jgi:hypothetical protein